MAEQFDLIVTGGLTVTASGAAPLDVAVTGESIAAVDQPGAFAGQGRRALDATGCIVIPGGVDPHVHFNLRLPSVGGGVIPDEGQEYSYAAAFGGTTTIIDFALWDRARWDQDHALGLTAAVAAKREEAHGRMAVDYGLHGLLIGNPPFEVLDEIGPVIESGIATIKTSSSCPPWTSDDGHRLGVMTEVARHGGLHILHAEDQAIIDWLTAKYVRQGKLHGAYTAETRGPLVEEAAIRRAILLSEYTGCPLFVLHVGAGRGAAAVKEARARQLPVFGETLVCYLSFTSEKLWDDDNHGLLWNNWPALKGAEDRSALWQAITDDGLQVVSSDHYVVKVADRYRGMGDTVATQGQAGQASVEMRLPVLFHLGVNEGRLSLERFVDLVSTNPAKLMGLYPRKGVLQPGSDADIVIFDPTKTWTVACRDHHMSADYNCWEGWELRGKVRSTMLRGTPLVIDEAWVGSKTGGRFLPRKIDPQFAGAGADLAATAATAHAGRPA
ncbi:MAG TPA: amidohydrolase family protein [Streptosporangiaceae bacterium]|jgi:dihydropyrimidinase